jgi:hypothetical protein
VAPIVHGLHAGPYTNSEFHAQRSAMPSKSAAYVSSFEAVGDLPPRFLVIRCCLVCGTLSLRAISHHVGQAPPSMWHDDSRTDDSRTMLPMTHAFSFCDFLLTSCSVLTLHFNYSRKKNYYLLLMRLCTMTSHAPTWYCCTACHCCAELVSGMDRTKGARGGVSPEGTPCWSVSFFAAQLSHVATLLTGVVVDGRWGHVLARP